MTTLIILYSIALLIVISGTLFQLKYFRHDMKLPSTNNNEQEFSIIIAVKNEEENLQPLFNSLEKIDYPQEKYEIIFVDDNSTDKSNALISEFAARHENIKLISAVDKKLPAKKGALTIGINAIRFENILITDADCIIQPKWLQICSKYFSSDGKIFFGKAPFVQDNSFANKLACFENIRSTFLTFSFSNAGLPYSAAARNFGFKKSAWQKLNGYTNTTETFSGDDDLLIREAVKKNYTIVAIPDNDAAVYSSTPSNLNDYIKQKSRHLSTSHFYLLKHQIMLGLWHSANIFSVTSLFFLHITYLFIFPFMIKILIDLFIIKSTEKELNYHFNILDKFFLQIIYEGILVLSFFLSLFSKKKW